MKRLCHIFNHCAETFNAGPLTLEFPHLFSHRTPCFFSSENTESRNPARPKSHFSMFGPPTFGFWSQSARKVPTRLKSEVWGFSSTLSVICQMKIADVHPSHPEG